MSDRGNPHYTIGLKERRKELLEKLLSTAPDSWIKIKAGFAYKHGLTERKVNEYFSTLKKAGLLDSVSSGNGY